ncbi:hypothetical protein NZK35_34040 [Stieleria sp. ICT_E10.1]|uniref:hypothetical protein n=1 Tax=Stieleria sedimenti TaxID=2976331 RepID=UPI00217F6988|nr:hypothetical protein [Stieleria sedimenti]MCS7471695.1 hypothetical protein [Stieleria sedimenti]
MTEDANQAMNGSCGRRCFVSSGFLAATPLSLSFAAVDVAAMGQRLSSMLLIGALEVGPLDVIEPPFPGIRF